MERANSRRSPLTQLAIFVLLSTLASLPVHAEKCARLRTGLRPAAATTIGLIADPLLGAPVLERAASAWSECAASGLGVPRLQVGQNGTRDLFVRFDPAAIGHNERCGEFSGRTITLFARTRKDSGAVVGCGSLSQNLVHELGHALGLADAPRSCTSFAMTTLHRNNAYHRRVQPSECALLQQRWRPLVSMRASSE